jgi:hypothetical protein
MVSGKKSPGTSKRVIKTPQVDKAVHFNKKILRSRLKEEDPEVKKILLNTFSPDNLGKQLENLSTDEKKYIENFKAEQNFQTDTEIVQYIVDTITRISLPQDRSSLSIPLLEKLDTLKTISYSEDIKKFKNRCNETRDPLYDIILDSLELLWVKKYRKTEAYHVFKIAKDFENVMFKDPRYRDHFIHQFQVFLSGLPIIDKHYDAIKQVYSKKFSESSEIEIEFSWMLAATFHDNGYLVQKFDKWLNSFFTEFLEIKDLPVKIDLYNLLLTRNFQEYIDKLTSLYLSLNDDPESKWSYDGAQIIEHKIRRELTSSLINNRNHGIISALILLDRIENSETSRKTTDYQHKFFQSVVFPAALAICLHDKEILTSEKIKPLDFNKDPLSFILIYCDTIQEWGRPIGPAFVDYDNKGLTLSKYEITNNNVSATITYDKIQTFETKEGEKTNFDFKEEELKKVFKKLRSKNITFEITLQSSDKEYEIPESTVKALR